MRERLGVGLLLLMLGTTFIGPVLPLGSPLDQNRDDVLQPPRGIRAVPASSSGYWLGTDALGRDVLVRTIHGTRYTVVTASFGVLLTVSLGAIVGTLAGFLGGRWDRWLMRSTELVMALPALYLVLAVRNLFPDALTPLQSALVTIIALAGVGWSTIARLVRAKVLSLREAEFVVAARAAGATPWRAMFRHSLPVLRPYVLLQLGITFPYFLVGETTLSFLGLGLQEPTPSLGNMLAGAIASGALLGRYWWSWVAPAGALTLIVLGVNLWLAGHRERDLFPVSSHRLPDALGG